jgi:hypothetical protein
MAVESGGAIDIESGGALKIANTAITASAAEINVLDGVVAGTATASKVAVLGANKNLDTLAIADNGLKLGAGAGTAVTATAAELNKTAGVTAGTVAASKAVVVGADKNIDTLAIADGGLKLGSGAGTAVSAKAAELNMLDGAPSAASVITVGAETGGNTINVAIQLNDAAGAALATRASVLAYLSDDANGDSVAATAPDGHVAVGTDGLCMHVITDKLFVLTSESDGDIDLNIVEAAGATWYLILILPNGLLKASGAITFAP